MLGELAYQNAKKRLDQLQRDIERSQRELAEVSAFLQLCERYAQMTSDEPSPALTPGISQSASTSAKARKKLTTVSGMDLLPYIRTAMLEIGRPLKRGEIVRALEERGIRVGGEEPARNVGTIMWRAKTERHQFESFEGMGYWPADVACSAAGYAPGAEDESEEETPERDRSASDASNSSDLWERAARGA